MLKGDTTQIDTLSVIRDSFEIFSDLPDSLKVYELDAMSALLIWPKPRPLDSIRVKYRVFPYLFNQTFSLKDRSIIRPKDESGFDPGFAYSPSVIPEGYNSAGRINKSGYLSRGISVGSGQDLSVNSDLNLQLTGYVTDDLQLLASISDANIPIQPGGNSQTLQDFDQVYINVFNDRFSLTGGDYVLRSRPSRYLNYFKRAQGANATVDFKQKDKISHKVMTSAAVSKGKYARNIFTAVEGNQGPYRLTGAEGETFVIVLAGTERVFIDGKLMKRGEEFDYVIDYNAAELTFTPNQPITKDKRIQVEFQYSDKNYARSIFQVSDHIEGKRFKAYISAYSEQDAKNQSLQQTLDPEDKGLLAGAGDDLFAATISAIDSTGYTPEGVHYELVDSLGYDSVFVFSTNPELADYTLGFSQVGEGNGDYIQNGFSANGRVFEWVVPDTINGQIIRRGSFAPFILLVSPKKQQVVAAGFETNLSKSIKVKTEGSVTNRDLNTFSSLDADDNLGYSGLLGLEFSKDSVVFKSWALKSVLEAEYLSEYFTTVERFRTVEFVRDWNLLENELIGEQLLTRSQLGIGHKKNGKLNVFNELLGMGSNYNGNKSGLEADLKLGKVKWKSTASYLSTSGELESDFYRHKNDLSYAFKPFRIGYQDELESNVRTDTTNTTSGYQFFDYQFYVMNPDSSKNKGKIFYRVRTDEVNVNGVLVPTAEATQIGGSYEWLSNKSQSAKLNVSRRTLDFKNDTTGKAREDNTLGRIEYRLKAFKNVFNTDFFYQVGSGLEQRREYVYLEVPAGQGVYVWNDYDEDEVRDLNEFEVAAFGYEANFIRTFIPSNNYQRVFSNGFNLNAGLDPARVWKNKTGVKKAFSKFSHQFSISTDRKTTDTTNEQRYNPFLTDVNESTLQALNSSVRNTLFYNKLSTSFGADLTIQNNANKVLLSNGLESRRVTLQRLNIRWNYSKSVVVKVALTDENRSSAATNTLGRNYNINAKKVSPEISWQPNNKLKLSVISDFSDKFNAQEGAEDTAELLTFGTQGRYSQPGKGTLELEANIIKVDYNGEVNSPLAFEMLEGLNTGTNYTWTVAVQQNLNKNIQLSVSYFGRKSESNPFIHSGGLQVRALF